MIEMTYEDDDVLEDACNIDKEKEQVWDWTKEREQKENRKLCRIIRVLYISDVNNQIRG